MLVDSVGRGQSGGFMGAANIPLRSDFRVHGCITRRALLKRHRLVADPALTLPQLSSAPVVRRTRATFLQTQLAPHPPRRGDPPTS